MLSLALQRSLAQSPPPFARAAVTAPAQDRRNLEGVRHLHPRRQWAKSLRAWARCWRQCLRLGRAGKIGSAWLCWNWVLCWAWKNKAVCRWVSWAASLGQDGAHHWKQPTWRCCENQGRFGHAYFACGFGPPSKAGGEGGESVEI